MPGPQHARCASVCGTRLHIENVRKRGRKIFRTYLRPHFVERVSARVFRNDIELSLGEGKLRTLGAALPDGTFTNLGLLLSDQCTPTVKAALFADDDRNIFTAREECTGSVLKQLSDAYAFLEHDNRYRTEYSGLERIDYHDVPSVALREALVNSIAHREYSLSGPTLISAMPSGVEIVSPGGLPLGIEEADLGAHISIPRNKMLANVLFRLEIIEAYGTGIGRVRASYADSEFDPSIRLTPNTLTVFLPNRNAAGMRAAEASDEKARALRDLLEGGPKTRRFIQESLGISQTTAIRMLGDLVNKGVIEKQGAGKNTMYMLK